MCCAGAVALPFTCDFEKDDICEMQLSSASNLDWTRRIGRASEQDTGPSGAQSYHQDTGPSGAQSGSYYMLVDSSMSDSPGFRAMSALRY